MNAIMRYGVPALFSWRTLTANAFAARTLPCPTPAGVKLAILGVLLRRDGPEKGQEHTSWLAPLPVAWHPPDRMAVRAATIRVWKGETPGEPLTGSVGMREYLHTSGVSGLALLNVSDNRVQDAMYALERLRSLGNAESLVQPTEPVQAQDDLPPGYVVLEAGSGQGEVSVLLDDLGVDPSFERLSVYRSPGSASVPRINVDRMRFLAQLPLRTTRRTADGYVLERVE